jgi:nucleoid-associated protein Lsr2
MARRVTVSLVDDLDGQSMASETVAFAIDGVSYEIDLSSKNAEKLRADLSRWVDAARRVGGRRRGHSAASAGGTANRAENAAMREWARRSGYEVANRGRLPADIVDAYRAAG